MVAPEVPGVGLALGDGSFMVGRPMVALREGRMGNKLPASLGGNVSECVICMALQQVAEHCPLRRERRVTASQEVAVHFLDVGCDCAIRPQHLGLDGPHDPRVGVQNESHVVLGWLRLGVLTRFELVRAVLDVERFETRHGLPDSWDQ